ncbi:hypothetical protein PGT21_009031 [Puccinia graminis f. sp. tritici]|uniref:Uncharacterized protein n=1 Tax=Puccinia graminis f. sp. tritici TaxID=56615 RepID=A0A5B0LNV7_PUCGR|nr:hypothetical protein PGT21_009031 [Puccinia graminis f. sp. tritici]
MLSLLNPSTLLCWSSAVASAAGKEKQQTLPDRCRARINASRVKRHQPPSPLCGISPLQQVAPAPNQATTSSLDQSTVTPPLRNSRRRERLPFIDDEAKKSALDDWTAKLRSFPTANPGGSRHPRTYTLIGRGNLIPSPQRGTLSRPAAASQGKFTRRERTPLAPTQAGRPQQEGQRDRDYPARVMAIRERMPGSRMSTSSQAKRPRQEEPSDRIDPYARVRAIRERMPGSRMSTSSQAKRPRQEEPTDRIDPYARVRAIRERMRGSRMTTSSQARRPRPEKPSDPIDDRIDPYARVRAIRERMRGSRMTTSSQARRPRPEKPSDPIDDRIDPYARVRAIRDGMRGSRKSTKRN